MEKERQIIFFDTHFQQFYIKLSGGVRRKIGYIFSIIRTVDKIPIKFLRHLKDGLFEIRIEYESNIYRVFCCFDTGNLVVLFNGYHKKTQKADKREVEKAMKLKHKYFDKKIKTMTKKDKILNTKTFDELLDVEYGKVGTAKRKEFEEQAQYFVISEMLKQGRKEANLTQEQLADKIGTKKSYISRLENGKCDIQLSTLYKIFELGLGKRVDILIK